ncbi:MAG: hypothetical protein IKJ98_06895 [Bacteroidales bacterium]|nr:hypothetical protein [Bacteroidales bacterium]
MEMKSLLRYGHVSDGTMAMRCCKVLLSVLLSFCFLFCNGQARLLYPKNEGDKWKGNNSYNFKWLKGKISYLCPVAGTDANSKYMRSFARVSKAEGEAVIASGNYVRRTCLSVSYNKDWVDWPNNATKEATTDNIVPEYPYIVYAYSTGDQSSGYDVRYWVDDGVDNDPTQYDDRIKPKLVGDAFQLFQIGTDVFKLQSIDISGWDFSETTSLEQFFSGCMTLSSVNFGTADFRNVKSIAKMFGSDANKQPNFSSSAIISMVSSWLVDVDKLKTRNAEARKHAGNTVTTANGVKYVIGSTGSFDHPVNGSTDMVVRNIDAVQERRNILFNFDVLYEGNGNVAQYVIQYLDGDKDWVENAIEIDEILSIAPTAAESDLKSYTPTYTPASPETFGGNKQFRIKIRKNNGAIEYSDPFMLVFDDSMLSFPDSYTIQKSVNGGAIEPHILYVDGNGDIGLPMNSGERVQYIVPEGMEIVCNNFYVSTSSTDYSNSTFINKGTIQAVGEIGLSSSKGDGITYDCNGVYVAEDITFRGKIPEIKGVFNIQNRFSTVSNGQGQDITIGDCATIRAYEGNFQHSGGAMKLYIDGEMTVERLIEGNMIHVRDGGMLIVGETDFDPSLKIVSYSGSVLSLCYNPTTGVDNLGFCAGTVYFNDNALEHGWSGNPQAEGDINEWNAGSHTGEYWTASDIVGKNPISAEQLIGAFHSYDECLDPANTHTLLGINDDPFHPKDKEVKSLYNDLNPCSDDFSKNKIQIREFGNKWFRLINGELIYCENDN